MQRIEAFLKSRSAKNKEKLSEENSHYLPFKRVVIISLFVFCFISITTKNFVNIVKFVLLISDFRIHYVFIQSMYRY